MAGALGPLKLIAGFGPRCQNYFELSKGFHGHRMHLISVWSWATNVSLFIEIMLVFSFRSLFPTCSCWEKKHLVLIKLGNSKKKSIFLSLISVCCALTHCSHWAFLLWGIYVAFSRAKIKIVGQEKLSLWKHSSWLKVQGLVASEPTCMKGKCGTLMFYLLSFHFMLDSLEEISPFPAPGI